MQRWLATGASSRDVAPRGADLSSATLDVEGVAFNISPSRVGARGLAAAVDVRREFAPHVEALIARGSLGFRRLVELGAHVLGGATFCLLADLKIRRRTGNRLGSRTARGVLMSGETSAQIWSFRTGLLETADASIGLAPCFARCTTRSAARHVGAVDLPLPPSAYLGVIAS